MSLINIIGKQKRGVIALSIKVKNIKYYDVCKECEFLYHCYGREIAERIQNAMQVIRIIIMMIQILLYTTTRNTVLIMIMTQIH